MIAPERKDDFCDDCDMEWLQCDCDKVIAYGFGDDDFDDDDHFVDEMETWEGDDWDDDE